MICNMIIFYMFYNCCNAGFMNIDIDAETSKLHAKEDRISISGRWGGISQPKTQVRKTNFFI